MEVLRLILNVIWIVLCGWWMAILYFLAGLIAFILIITIPFGVAAWRRALRHSRAKPSSSIHLCSVRSPTLACSAAFLTVGQLSRATIAFGVA